MDSELQAIVVVVALLLLFSVPVGAFLIILSIMERRRKKLVRGHSLTRPGPQPRTLVMSLQPPATTAEPADLPPPFNAWAGTLLFLAGFAAYAFIHNWNATRIFTPVDMPVSLRSGHIRTGPFPVNLNETYLIDIQTDDMRSYSADCDRHAILSTRWVLYRDGKTADRSDAHPSLGGNVDVFTVEKGSYDLDVEVLKDAGCLNPAHPRLSVFAVTSKSAYDDFTAPLLWLCSLSSGAGICLLMIYGNRRLGTPPAPIAPWQPGMGQGHTPWKVRRSRLRLFSGMPSYGFTAAIIYMVPAIFMASDVGFRLIPVGLRVRLLRPGTLSRSSPGIQPLLVRLESAGIAARPDLFVDSQRVTWENFEVVLQNELKYRPPNWPVYLEGDPGLEWKWPAHAIDRIRGLRIDVILLTRRTISAREQRDSAGKRR